MCIFPTWAPPLLLFYNFFILCSYLACVLYMCDGVRSWNYIQSLVVLWVQGIEPRPLEDSQCSSPLSQCPITGFYCLCFLIFMVWLVKSCTIESQAKKALFEKLTHSVFCRNIYLNHVFPCVLQYHTTPSDLIAIHGRYLLFLQIDLNLTGKKAAINILGDPRKVWHIRYYFPKYTREKH